jgi:hypothetical protein
MSQSTVYRRALLNPASDGRPQVLEERRAALYFANPYGKRISEYEQVLLHAQPNPDWIPGGIGQGGWGTVFPGGRGTWENYFTEAKTSDWFAFRDPEGRWQRPYVAEKADEWREFQRLVATFTGQGLEGDVDHEWIEPVITTHLGALALHDYGAFMALGAPIRDCLVDTLRAAIVTASLDVLDNAQMILAEKIYWSQALPEVTAAAAPSETVWASSEVWRGARRFVEQLWGDTYDHIEVLFALHVVHEPLFGKLVRQEFFSKHAPAHGDAFTPRALWFSARAAEAAGRWIRELFGRTLAADPTFGEYNRRLMRYWAEKWVPLEIDALRDVTGLWSTTERLRASRASSGLVPSVERTARHWAAHAGSLLEPVIHVQDLVGAVVGDARTP